MLSKTGDPQAARRAVQQAQAGIQGLYDHAMVQTRGDQQAARAIQYRHADKVAQLAGLLPDITGSDPSKAGPALRQALGLLDQAGMTDREWLKPWLREHVKDNRTLRAAGLNPDDIRKTDTPWAYIQSDALLALAKNMLNRYEKPDGTRLNASEISDYMDQARAAARRYGVGSRYVPEATSDSSSEESDSTQTTNLQSLGVPLRI